MRRYSTIFTANKGVAGWPRRVGCCWSTRNRTAAVAERRIWRAQLFFFFQFVFFRARCSRSNARSRSPREHRPSGSVIDYRALRESGSTPERDPRIPALARLRGSTVRALSTVMIREARFAKKGLVKRRTPELLCSPCAAAYLKRCEAYSFSQRK